MNQVPTQCLLISRVSNMWLRKTPPEGVIYQVDSTTGHYSLKVRVAMETGRLLGVLPVVAHWILRFEGAAETLNAAIFQFDQTVNFYSSNCELRGRVREAGFSVIGKFIVEDESEKLLGWIRCGFLRDHFFSADGREIGFLKRASWKFVFGSPKARLAERFQFFYDAASGFDDRLLDAWFCRHVWGELYM